MGSGLHFAKALQTYSKRKLTQSFYTLFTLKLLILSVLNLKVAFNTIRIHICKISCVRIYYGIKILFIFLYDLDYFIFYYVI